MFIFQALENSPIEIFGDGDHLLRLFYVEDVAKLIIDYIICDGKVTETFELAAGICITVEALAKRIVEMTGSKSDIVYLPRRLGENTFTQFTPGPDVRNLLGEVDFTNFCEGMQRTIEWYKNLSADKVMETRQFYVGAPSEQN
jgi:nucleoside-diphosphate-sugar epimerase